MGRKKTYLWTQCFGEIIRLPENPHIIPQATRVPTGHFTENTKYSKAATGKVVKERLYLRLVRVEKTPPIEYTSRTAGRLPHMNSWFAGLAYRAFYLGVISLVGLVHPAVLAQKMRAVLSG